MNSGIIISKIFNNRQISLNDYLKDKKLDLRKHKRYYNLYLSGKKDCRVTMLLDLLEYLNYSLIIIGNNVSIEIENKNYRDDILTTIKFSKYTRYELAKKLGYTRQAGLTNLLKDRGSDMLVKNLKKIISNIDMQLIISNNEIEEIYNI